MCVNMTCEARRTENTSITNSCTYSIESTVNTWKDNFGHDYAISKLEYDDAVFSIQIQWKFSELLFHSWQSDNRIVTYHMWNKTIGPMNSPPFCKQHVTKIHSDWPSFRGQSSLWQKCEPWVSTNRSEYCHLWGIDKLILWDRYVLKQLR